MSGRRERIITRRGTSPQRRPRAQGCPRHTLFGAAVGRVLRDAAAGVPLELLDALGCLGVGELLVELLYTPVGMSDDENRRPYGPPDMPAGGRAGETAAADERASRGPLATTLLVLTILAAASAAVTFVYGIYNFPDAPIRPSAGGYVGKGGKPHTAEEYERFLLWERALLITFPAAFLAGFAYEFSTRRKRKR
jgi:hypothetical protein